MDSVESGWTRLEEVLGTARIDWDRVLQALVAVWPDDAGSSMFSSKLNRWESPIWSPPLLEFEIERHGGTVMGSTRAEVQSWTVNVEDRSVELMGSRPRQLTKAAPRLDVVPLARQCLDEMNAGPEGGSDWLMWPDETRVRVKISRIIPETNKQTTAGRRKRFREALNDLAAATDWREESANSWMRAPR